MAAAAPLLSLEGLGRRFGGLQAVDDVTMSIGQGELVGLIGPNGAGKTTLFNIVTGFTPPSAGRVFFKSKRIDKLTPHKLARRGIARTFQNLRLFSNLSVFDNVAAAASGTLGFQAWRALLPFAGKKRADEITARTWDALDRVELRARANDFAANLSYGQRKYLEIARALALRPDLLILDEPAAGLNETETASLTQFLRTLNAGGMTILLVEHDMGLVMSLCRRVIVLAAGRKIADGTPDQVRADKTVQEAYLGKDE